MQKLPYLERQKSFRLAQENDRSEETYNMLKPHYEMVY